MRISVRICRQGYLGLVTKITMEVFFILAPHGTEMPTSVVLPTYCPLLLCLVDTNSFQLHHHYHQRHAA